MAEPISPTDTLTPIHTHSSYDVTVDETDHVNLLVLERSRVPATPFPDPTHHPESLEKHLESIPGVQCVGYDDAGDPRISYQLEALVDNEATHRRVCSIIQGHLAAARAFVNSQGNISPKISRRSGGS